jgi:hypothetical protein
MRILLTMQGNTQRDQSPGVSLRISIVARHLGKVIRYDLEDVCGNPACLPASFAEAVKSQVLLRLAQRIRDVACNGPTWSRIHFNSSDGVLVLVHPLIGAGDCQGIGFGPAGSPGEHIGCRIVDIRFVGLGHGH